MVDQFKELEDDFLLEKPINKYDRKFLIPFYFISNKYYLQRDRITKIRIYDGQL